MPEALRLVRRELGPDAAVLHTRELGAGLWEWLTGRRGIEVTASTRVPVPSRFPLPEERPLEVRTSEEQSVDRPASGSERLPRPLIAFTTPRTPMVCPST